MTIEQAFNHLLNNWAANSQEFKNKYRQYKSKFEKSKGMKKAEILEKKYYVGNDKKREMLLAARYKAKPEIWIPPK